MISKVPAVVTAVAVLCGAMYLPPPAEAQASFLDAIRELAATTHASDFVAPGDDPDGPSLDREGTFRRGDFPGTGKRMEMYRMAAPALGAAAVEALLGGGEASGVTVEGAPEAVEELRRCIVTATQ